MKLITFFLIIVFAVNTLLAIIYVMGFLAFNTYVGQSLTAVWFMVLPVIALHMNVKDDDIEDVEG